MDLPERPGAAPPHRRRGTTVWRYDFFLYGTAAGIIAFNKLYSPSEDPTLLILGVATCLIGLVPTYDSISIGTAAPVAPTDPRLPGRRFRLRSPASVLDGSLP